MIKLWIAAHPFLALAVVVGVIGAVAWLGLKVIEKYLVTAARDGRYMPRGGNGQ